MYLCSEGHDEVCYEGNHCPACELKDELSTEKDETSRLQDEVDKLEKELEEERNKE